MRIIFRQKSAVLYPVHVVLFNYDPCFVDYCIRKGLTFVCFPPVALGATMDLTHYDDDSDVPFPSRVEEKLQARLFFIRNSRWSSRNSTNVILAGSPALQNRVSIFNATLCFSRSLVIFQKLRICVPWRTQPKQSSHVTSAFGVLYVLSHHVLATLGLQISSDAVL